MPLTCLPLVPGIFSDNTSVLAAAVRSAVLPVNSNNTLSKQTANNLTADDGQ